MGSTDKVTSENEECELSVIMASGELTVELVEADIPGARLSEPFSSHTIHKLRWWLLCRGGIVPAAWNKKRILARYVAIGRVLLCALMEFSNRLRISFRMLWM